MLNRRSLLAASVLLPLMNAAGTAWPQSSRRIVFVHGRAQEGKDPIQLRETWIAAFREGADAAGIPFPEDVDIALPFYGDKLDEFTQQLDLPLTSDIQARGEDSVNEEFLLFQAEIAEELRVRSQISEEQVDAEYGNNPREKGPLNWEWVQAILRALDKHGGGINQLALEHFTRDVFLYTRRSLVQETIDKIVADEITEEPTVVVGHSLGSVVAYSVLRYGERELDIPLFVTVGSPLGVRAIRNRFRPLRRPDIGRWFNAFDDRDVVSLYPLDDENFGVTPAIENYDDVKNHTDNRHGIVGYLDDETVAGQILSELDMH